MTIEELYEMWGKDSEIDTTNLTFESANIPKLHNKYFREYMQENIRLKQMKGKYSQLKLLKERYYRGELDFEELKENKWHQMSIKILRNDIPGYMDADPDIIAMSLKIGIQSEKVSYLESIIKMINNRGFQIKHIIDWERFRSGSL